jgi:uncharacterized protein
LPSHLQGINESRIKQERRLLGPLLETFVASELQKQLGWNETLAKLYHYRSHEGHEVDFVLEDRSGQLIAIEVKATATPISDDFKGLHAFAKTVGKRLHRGFLLHLGQRTTKVGDKLWGLPVSALWKY